MLFVHLAKKRADGFAGMRIHIAGRFVGQQKARFADQGPGQGNPLLLSARQFSRAMMASLFQPDFAAAALRPVRPLPVGMRP